MYEQLEINICYVYILSKISLIAVKRKGLYFVIYKSTPDLISENIPLTNVSLTQSLNTLYKSPKCMQ